MSDKLVKMSKVLGCLEDMVYALDDIHAESEYSATLVESGWISCGDRLPEDSKRVLVTDGENIEITLFDGSEWEMYNQYGNHYELYGDVTHWMPLPIPPLHEAEAEEERARTAGYDGSF